MAQRGSKQLSNTTTNHEAIRRWAEERGGTPAEVIGTASDDQPGIIRIDFPGWSGEGKLRPISWDEWFRKFDDANLAFVYEDRTATGERSNFNKLVARETAAARSRGERTSRRKAGARAGAAGRTGSRREATRGAVARTTKRGGSRTQAPSRRGTRSTSRSRKGARAGSRTRAGSRSKARSRSRSRSR